MKALTLRKIPREVARKIQERARAERISATKAVLRILEEALGLARKRPAPVENHDFDFLFGTWTKKQADEFDAALREMRKVDPKDWE